MNQLGHDGAKRFRSLDHELGSEHPAIDVVLGWIEMVEPTFAEDRHGLLHDRIARRANVGTEVSTGQDVLDVLVARQKPGVLSVPQADPGDRLGLLQPQELWSRIER
jgi:hypothetical protein